MGTLVSWVSRTGWNTLQLPFLCFYFLGQLQRTVQKSGLLMQATTAQSSPSSSCSPFPLVLPLTSAFPLHFFKRRHWSHPPPLSSLSLFFIPIYVSLARTYHTPYLLLSPLSCFPPSASLIFCLCNPTFSLFPSSYAFCCFHLHTLLYLPHHSPPDILCSLAPRLPSTLPACSFSSRTPSLDTSLTHGLLISKSKMQTYKLIYGSQT